MEFNNQKTITTKREELKLQSPVHYSRSNQSANMQLIDRSICKGFQPKWYAVLHYNDGGSSKKYQQRRVDPFAVEEDLGEVRKQLYTELYGRKWEKVKNRSKSLWGIEYGRNQHRPHINLIIEVLPFPFDDYRSFYVLLDRILPKSVRCLWRRSAYLQPVEMDTFNTLNSYCNKESDFRNCNLAYSINDFQ